MWTLTLNLTRRAVGCLLAATVLALPACALDVNQPGAAYPGTLNYVEGQASVGNEAVSPKSIGSTQLAAGQTLSTERGKAELLLTPGVFLRLGDNSAVKMISPNLTDTDVLVEKGEATVEVAEIHPQNRLVISESNGTARLTKTGFYDFDANAGQVRVFEGEALVQANDSDKQIKVKGGHEVDLNATNFKSRGFDKKTYESSELYNWSSLRSAYLAEANADVAPSYVGGDGWLGPGWFGAGWYWDPWFGCYTFLPGDGLFYSPFGWGFCSPLYAYGYFGRFYGGRHYWHHFGSDPHAWGPRVGNGPVLHGNTFRGLNPGSPLTSNPRGFREGSAIHGGFEGGGFHGGEPGGFHGGASGGFHGGGFGGGFHGGPGR